jgi:IS5 family transposase
MTHGAEPDVPGVADGNEKSTKIALFLLKEEIGKPLRKLEDYLNELPGILDVFDLENHRITRRSASGTVNF